MDWEGMGWDEVRWDEVGRDGDRDRGWMRIGVSLRVGVGDMDVDREKWKRSPALPSPSYARVSSEPR